MIACVGSTDGGRVHSSLPSHGQGVVARPSSGGGGEPGECLEVQSELADVIRDLVEGVGAGGGTGGRVAAGVSRVPDVGGVGGDGGATGGGVDHTAHSEPSSTVAISAAALGRALRAGVAGPVGGGGAGARALLVRELDDGEEREGLWREIDIKIVRFTESGNLLPALSSVACEGGWDWEARARLRAARSSPRTCCEVLMVTRRV